MGNPGKEYENTRHNAGFMVGDLLASQLGTKINKLRFYALTATVKIGDVSVLLMKPQTYMNNSGTSVAEAVRFYKIPAERVLVVSDEMALRPGRIRLRKHGSAGGHNGLSSIIKHLGTSDFPRIRIGIGQPAHRDYNNADWVLGRFSSEDSELAYDAAKRAAEAACVYISGGAEAAMSEFNGNAAAKKESNI